MVNNTIFLKSTLNEGNTVSNSGALILKEIDRTQKGNYTCEVKNKYGESTVELKLDVGYKPVGYAGGDEIDLLVVDLHDQLELECAADSHPPVHTIEWDFTNHTETPTLKQGEIIRNNTESYRIVSLRVKLEHNGKLLKCRAVNQFGGMEYSFRFVIDNLTEPRIISTNESSIYSPELTKTIEESVTSVVVCHVKTSI